ncbi:MAG: cupin domain-containing protein, partial [Xanthomonadales bacterium]|nr:cupin domain-containing protein [Xanthomonadales bacterium]
PFDDGDFAALPATGWTLLVQDVEKHYPPLRQLLANFDFLPNWRIDDLMVSVAGRGGSVGPHVDQYDVFLLQAAGRRRWQIARTFEPGLLPDCELNILERFEPEDDWILEPGDVLYLPPGVAHHGVALDQGMTWSFGMRAPSAADLMQSLGEWLAGRTEADQRYQDPDLRPARRSGEVDAAAIGRFRALVGDAPDDLAAFAGFLGAFLSRYRLAHEPAPPPRGLSLSELKGALERGAEMAHNPWTRLLWLDSGAATLLFAAGEAFECSRESAEAICDEGALRTAGAALIALDSNLILELLNRGHLILEPL